LQANGKAGAQRTVGNLAVDRKRRECFRDGPWDGQVAHLSQGGASAWEALIDWALKGYRAEFSAGGPVPEVEKRRAIIFEIGAY